MILRISVFLVLFSIGWNVPAIDTPLEFENPEMERRYNNLIEEIRCLVCQNQSLADSNADLAQDLRLEIHNMIIEGKNNDAIISYLVDRYGDFVLYRPPFKPATLFLWFGPVLFMIIGIMIVVFFLRKQKSVSLDTDEHERASSLLEPSRKDTEQ